MVAASAVPAWVWPAVVSPSPAAWSGVAHPAQTLGRSVPPCPTLTAAAGLAAGMDRALLQAARRQHGRVPRLVQQANRLTSQLKVCQTAVKAGKAEDGAEL